MSDIDPALLAYRPEILRLARPADRRRWDDLVHAGHPPRIVDSLQSQLEDLAEIRHPQDRLDAAARARIAASYLADRPAADYGVWVYYPWAHTLVHLLDEAEFVAVRTSRNQYKITPAEQARLGQVRVGIVGLSVGQAVAVTMAMERVCGEIRLADFDTLALTNLNRVRARVHEIGLPKAIIAAREIAEIDPYLTVRCALDGVTEANLDAFLLDGGRLDLLVDESDSLDIKLLARTRARELGIPVLMETSDRGMIDVERFDLEPDRPILHGLVGDLDAATVRGLTTPEKIPHVLQIIGEATISPEMRASLPEIGRTIPAWPQLASAVALGGAVVTDVSRRIALGHEIASGRTYVDLHALVPSRLPAGNTSRGG